MTGARPGSLINLSSALPDLSLSFEQPVKASPDRYRRQGQKRFDSSNTVPKAPSQLGAAPAISTLSTDDAPQISEPVHRQASVDDTSLPKTGQSELAKRYRRRSLNQLDTQNILSTTPLPTAPGAQQGQAAHGPSATSTPTTIRPVSFVQAAEAELLPRQSSSSAAAKPEVAQEKEKPVEPVKSYSAAVSGKPDTKVIVPPRGSSDGSKRLAAPSPLSKQTSDGEDQSPAAPASPPRQRTYAAVAQAAVASPSPAAQQLAAVSDKDLNKGMKSKLRRAFSFGSAQELRKAAGEKQVAANQAQQIRQQHQQQIDDEMDAEQLEIARRQEAAGIGAGIYSGQGGFTGSTDNLSISSTASSASVMLRKMGRGAKKGARSIKGLFRPKSVIGVPAADGPIDVGHSPALQPTVAQISMVTVEAERQQVNVNVHPEDLPGGGTGFPKLERNSLDAATAAAAADMSGSSDKADSLSRRSIVGSDKDRAEVLAAVKKGILKRSGTNSPSGSPVVRPNESGLPQVPHITESPSNSLPGTPKETPQGRSSSAPNVNGDYFTTRVTLGKSMPNTPNGSVRSITFSPRIQFHDAWSSVEYDRRGEIATCNRLTPMLAQQIKEELNTFKMVSHSIYTLSKTQSY